MQNKKAIVIGSGVAGMATAIRLSVQGYQVDVYEKNNYVGGKLTHFAKGNFHFDAGPSLFVQPKNIEELFTLANEPIENYFSYTPVDICCKYFFENGKTINAYRNLNSFADEMQEKTNDSSSTILNYLVKSEKLYKNTGNIFLNKSLHKRKTWLHKNVIKALFATKPQYIFNSFNTYNRSQLKSKEAIQIFNRFATYNGSNPYKAPGMLSVIPHLEFNEGVFFPKGGMISITDALYKLALKKGIHFHFGAAVQHIIQHQSKVKGIVVNNENVMADVVISNADIYFTYKNLLNNVSKSEKLLKQERSSSAVIFYWGMNKTFAQLGLHNIFFSADYKKEFDSIFKNNAIAADPTIYINITSKMEQGHAPQGSENWFVMINAPANIGQNWQSIKENLKQNIITKLNRVLGENIEDCIIEEETLDPITIEEKTSSYKGSLYGTSSNTKMAAFNRHANFTNTFTGLYFCGGTTHPGGGIPLCLKSAKIVSELIATDKRIRK